MSLSQSTFKFMLLWLVVLAGGLGQVKHFTSKAQTTAKMHPQRVTPVKLSAFGNNQCVICHSQVTEPVRISAHYFEWLSSPHANALVSCEKCHGGDPAAKTAAQAHQTVFRSNLPLSTLAPKRAPETCFTCHQAVVTAFTKSKHYQRLLESNDGPSCTTCHQHMATRVVNYPPNTTKLCASCHNLRGPATNSTDIPATAGDTIAAFTRANEVLEWSQYLIAHGGKRAPRFTQEQAELARYAKQMQNAKVSWHTFELTASRQQADQVFSKAVKIMDRISAQVK